MKSSIALCIALFTGLTPAWTDAPFTTITAPKSLIVSTAFGVPAPPVRKGTIQGWQAAIGEWKIQDGALHGTELKEDHHPSSCTYKIDATDLILSAEVRLGSASQIALGIRDTVAPHHHLARTFLTPEAVWITHMSGIAKTTQSSKVAEIKMPIDPQAWHTLTIEIAGDHYRATIDGKVVEGRHPRFQDAKGMVALINKGEGAQFRNVSIWKAQPKNVR
jgi:hypothetical protein